ncbi:MAG: hypothetical protein H6994_00790 [Pseudomonadales bacterium]|nr:hypothetical protein [Pseudomonadales bacterium]
MDALRRYPEPTAADCAKRWRLRSLLQEHFILVTNSGDEACACSHRSSIRAPTFSMATPSYSLYSVLARIQDASCTPVPLLPDWTMPAVLSARSSRPPEHAWPAW